MTLKSIAYPGATSLPPALPLLRSTVQFGRDPLGFFVKSYQRYGPTFRLKAFDFNLTVMLGAGAHHAIFAEHAGKLSVRKGYSLLLPLMDDALLVSDGARHARQKRLMQPAFHARRIESYLDIMREVVERRTTLWPDGGVVDVYAEARRTTLEIVIRALLGVDIRADYQTMASTITEVFRYVTMPGVRKIIKWDVPWAAYGRSRRAQEKLDALIFDVIRERRAHPTMSDDMLAWLLEARDEEGSQLSDDSIRDQVLLLIYAGHDTATCSVAWALHLLATHSCACQAVVEEQARRGLGAPISLDDLRAMPQLEMALDETLRLYPPVWIGLRGVTETFEFEGLTIPAGSSVMYSAGVSHRLPDAFPNPLEFDPTRFAPENKSKLPAFSYVPFGGGAHMCIGMPFAQAELKLLVAHIISNWRLEPVSDKPIALRYNPTLAPKHGILLRVSRRRSGVGLL
jgi:cytochrome P450